MVGTVDALLAVPLYAIGWDRAFGYDASRTVGQFVTADSLSRVFRQDRFNNHPLFSFVEYVVHQLTGSADERVLRLVPIACGALAVGTVAAVVASHFGPSAGHVAGSMLALNPLALQQFREVRGYSLLTLAAMVATLVLVNGLAGGRFGAIARYVVAGAVAVGTHLFALGLLAVHAVVVLRQRHRPAWRWLAALGAVAAVGLVVQWPAIVDGLRRPPRYDFDPAFPAMLAFSLLGGVAFPGVVVLVAAAWAPLRSRPWAVSLALGTGAIVVAAWLAGPAWLDSRFFIWLAPAPAAAAGVGVATRPTLLPVAIACAATQLVLFAAQAPTTSEVPNRMAANFVRHHQDAGRSVCALGRTRASLLVYVDDVQALWNFRRLDGCDVAVEAAGPAPQPLLGAACDRFSHVLVLAAKHPGALFADQPLQGVGEQPSDVGNAARWERTDVAEVCVDPPLPKGYPGP